MQVKVVDKALVSNEREMVRKINLWIDDLMW